MEIVSIIFFILGIILCLYGWYKTSTQKQIDKDIKEKNEKLLKSYNDLLEKENILINKLNLLELQEQKETDKIKELNILTEDMNKSAASAFEEYMSVLENSYKQKEDEFENSVNILNESYNNLQDEYLLKIDKVKQDLDKISATRAAAMEAQLREQEIRDLKTYYSLNLSLEDLKDAKILKEIEYKLHNPRILRMLIWQNFYREPMNKLCNNVIGISIKSGIYKITNQLNNICYIGQAVDLAKRWKDHAKCGLGIDAPVNNKLYKAMQEDGLENFTWEILEECKSNELNEKEKFYIELYQADKFGYNSKGGNK